MGSASALSFTSDSLFVAALAAGLGAIALSGLMVVAIALLRIARSVQDGRTRATVERWRPLFFAALAGAAPAPRPAPRTEARDVIALLHRLMLEIRGEGRGRLAAYARSCGLEDWARRFALAGQARGRLRAIAALGQTQSDSSFETLARIVGDANPALSLAAARSMLAIDTARAAGEIVRRAVERDDWPAARVLAILQDNPHEELARAVLVAFETTVPDRLPRLLAFARLAQPDKLWPVLHRLLEAEHEPEILSGALRLVADPREAPRVRPLLRHPEWIVRLAAVQALGRIAAEEDLPRLTAALADRVWWVRQRAADVLVGLPFFGRPQLERLREVLSDRYARDALARAIAEHFPA